VGSEQQWESQGGTHTMQDRPRGVEGDPVQNEHGGCGRNPEKGSPTNPRSGGWRLQKAFLSRGAAFFFHATNNHQQGHQKTTTRAQRLHPPPPPLGGGPRSFTPHQGGGPRGEHGAREREHHVPHSLFDRYYGATVGANPPKQRKGGEDHHPQPCQKGARESLLNGDGRGSRGGGPRELGS